MSLKLARCLLLAAALAASAAMPACAGAEKPARIVSLNLCADQILLDLVSRDRIAALSFLAVDPSMSAVAAEARGMRTVRGAAEEVLALDPDLVLAGASSTPATVDLLRRLGRRVLTLPLASSFAEIRNVVRQVAHATGEDQTGEALIARFDERLAAAKGSPGGRVPTVVAYQVNSLVAGADSLIDEVFRAAGFANMAATQRLGPAGRLPLETFVLSPPDVVVLANAPDDFRTVLGDNLRHPAFAAVLESRLSLHLPMSLWLCGTPRIVSAVERLAALRAEWQSAPPTAGPGRP